MRVSESVSEWLLVARLHQRPKFNLFFVNNSSLHRLLWGSVVCLPHKFGHSHGNAYSLNPEGTCRVKREKNHKKLIPAFEAILQPLTNTFIFCTIFPFLARCTFPLWLLSFDVIWPKSNVPSLNTGTKNLLITKLAYMYVGSISHTIPTEQCIIVKLETCLT